jgi:hypothetical protein
MNYHGRREVHPLPFFPKGRKFPPPTPLYYYHYLSAINNAFYTLGDLHPCQLLNTYICRVNMLILIIMLKKSRTEREREERMDGGRERGTYGVWGCFDVQENNLRTGRLVKQAG